MAFQVSSVVVANMERFFFFSISNFDSMPPQQNANVNVPVQFSVLDFYRKNAPYVVVIKEQTSGERNGQDSSHLSTAI